MRGSTIYNSRIMENGPDQIPDIRRMTSEDYDPTNLAGDAYTLPSILTDEEEALTGDDGTGAFSGSPNMERDRGHFGNGDTLGNNDGTEPDPERVD